MISGLYLMIVLRGNVVQGGSNEPWIYVYISRPYHPVM